MDPAVKRHTGLLISAWFVSILALALAAPLPLLMFFFSGDNNSPNRDVQMAAPMIFLVLPIVAQITYLCRCYRAAKGIAIAAITLCGLAVGIAGICVLYITL